jgi:hypothetical protein
VSIHYCPLFLIFTDPSASRLDSILPVRNFFLSIGTVSLPSFPEPCQPFALFHSHFTLLILCFIRGANCLSYRIIPSPSISCDTDSSYYPMSSVGEALAKDHPPAMAVTMADDELFTRAISGYRDAFLDRHSHLPESERNRLWSQRLSQFLPATASSSYRPVPGSGIPDTGSSLEKSGKRIRQDTPRTLPGSGLPPTKRRVTVCDLSWSPAPASFPPSVHNPPCFSCATPSSFS